MSKTLKERFEEKIKGGKWVGSVNNIGYPKMKVDGKMMLASHVALKLKGKTVADSKVVMHKNNDKLDMSHTNLRIGTQKQNLKQMRDEGRDRPRGVDQEPDVKKASAYDYFFAAVRNLYA